MFTDRCNRSRFALSLGMAIALGAAALAPAPGHAKDLRAFVGKYDLFRKNCGKSGSDGAFRIERRAIKFWEGTCSLRSVRSAGFGKASIATLRCTSEGETYTSNLLLALDIDGELLMYYDNNDATLAYRCRK